MPRKYKDFRYFEIFLARWQPVETLEILYSIYSIRLLISKRHTCLLEVISGCNISSFCATIFILNVYSTACLSLYTFFLYLFYIYLFYIFLSLYTFFLYLLSLGFMDKYERITKWNISLHLGYGIQCKYWSWTNWFKKFCLICIALYILVQLCSYIYTYIYGLFAGICIWCSVIWCWYV